MFVENCFENGPLASEGKIGPLSGKGTSRFEPSWMGWPEAGRSAMLEGAGGQLGFGSPRSTC